MAPSWPLTRRRFFIILLSSITGPAVFWLTTNKGGGLHFPHLCICLFTFLPISVIAYFRICLSLPPSITLFLSPCFPFHSICFAQMLLLFQIQQLCLCLCFTVSADKSSQYFVDWTELSQRCKPSQSQQVLPTKCPTGWPVHSSLVQI